MFILNRKSDISLYEQLKQQILSGNMKAGQRLPATRELAAEYQISRNTVINAYYQLEIEGYIKPVTGSGHYVEHLPPTKVPIPKPTFFPYDSESTDTTYDYFPMAIWIIIATTPKPGENVCWMLTTHSL